MKLKIYSMTLVSILVAVDAYAQETGTNAAKPKTSELIRQEINRILTPQESSAGAQRISAEQAIADWKQKPKDEAKKLIAKYGQPNEVTSQRLIWRNNGPWKCTELVNEEIQHDFPIQHTDFLKQTIDYRVPPEKFSELAEFDGSVIAERTKGELSARCDKEENNILGINLAQDIARGNKSAEEAREFFTQTIAEAKKGEKPAYMQSLQFQVAKSGTTDPDETTLLEESAGAEPKKVEQK